MELMWEMSMASIKVTGLGMYIRHVLTNHVPIMRTALNSLIEIGGRLRSITGNTPHCMASYQSHLAGFLYIACFSCHDG